MQIKKRSLNANHQIKLKDVAGPTSEQSETFKNAF